MRITFNYEYEMARKRIEHAQREYVRAETQVDRGQNLLDPYDSPVNYITAHRLSRMLEDYNQFNKNAEDADGWMSYTDTRIAAITKQLQEARYNLGVYGAQDTHTEESTKSLAASIQQLYANLIDLGNSEYGGRYIFSGYQTGTKPIQSGANSVSHIMHIYGKGGTITPRKVFSDLPEMKSGEYTLEVIPKGDTGYLRIYDKYGKPVLLDTNGSDDATSDGNNLAKEISFKLEPGAIINTGRGVSLTLPEELTSAIKFEFEYTAGTDYSYLGDDGRVNNIIGVYQDVTVNITGKELFYQNNRVIKGNVFNTSNGLPINASTRFSQIDKSKSGVGDSIKIKGTDHNGRIVGAANLIASNEVRLNLENATKDERTLVVGYGGKFYQIEVPQKGYKDMDELVSVLNKELSRAVYAGAQTPSSYLDKDDLEMKHRSQLGGLTDLSGNQYEVDLSDEIRIVADGNRLSFTTSTSGDQVVLSVSGFKSNTLGFDDETIGALGKSTTFNIGGEFDNYKGTQNIYTTHKDVDVNAAKLSFLINGQDVVIKGLDLATTKEEKELLIDRALKSAGFGSTVGATLTPNAGGGYDLTFTMQNLNCDTDTHLSTSYGTATGNDYQMSVPVRNSRISWSDKHLGEFTNFIEELYGDTVEASIVDGRIMVTDKLSGQSRMSFEINPTNKGIGSLDGEKEHILTGKYNGYADKDWRVKTYVTDNGGRTDVKVEVYDRSGKLLYTKIKDDYAGEELELLEGVRIIVKNKVPSGSGATDISSFNVHLTGQASLNFGDMNVINEGRSANMFHSLQNLIDALDNQLVGNSKGEPTGVIKEPSAWRDTNFKATAVPHFGGKFTGNYNANYKYEVVSKEGKMDYFLQKEFVKNTGVIRHHSSMNTAKFSISIYNNETKAVESYPMTVDLSAATDAAQVREAIIDAVNNNGYLHDNGVKVHEKDGRLVFSSGSGTQNIDIKPADKDTLYLMGTSYETRITPMEPSSTKTSSFNVNYYKGGAWLTRTVTLTGGYTDPLDAVAKINALIQPDVTVDSVGGSLAFTAGAGVTGLYYDDVRGDGSLGIANNSLNYVSSKSAITLDTSEINVAERTMNFSYLSGGTKKTASITIDAREYRSTEDLVEHINSKLAAQGLAGSFEALAGEDKRIMFSPGAGTSGLTVEGGYEGKLGFPRTGDKVQVKVTDEKGGSIQNITLDTANNFHDVVDGLVLAFDAGSLRATDSFTGRVGSGVRFELDVLDQVENQILMAYTKLGNRQARVKSVMTYYGEVKKTLEDQKNVELGATLTDQQLAMFNKTLAQSVYDKALRMTASVMTMSLLDYLR